MKNDILAITEMPDWSRPHLKRLAALKECRIEILVSGKLRITYIEEGKEKPRQYLDILSAIRAQDHIIEGYLGNNFEHGEIDTVRQIENKLAQTRAMLTSWQRVSGKEVEDMDQELSTAKDILARARNQYKTAAHKQLIKMAGFRDKSGNINPGAMAARSTASMDRLAKRQKQVNINMPFAAKRKLALINEQSYMRINQTEALVKMKYLEIFFIDIITRTDYFRRLINETQYFLSGIWALPYSRNISKVNRILYSLATYKVVKPESTLKSAILLIHEMNI